MLVISQAKWYCFTLVSLCYTCKVVFPEQIAMLLRGPKYPDELSVEVSALHLLAEKCSTHWV